MAARRVSSAEIARSTTSSDRPRLAWAARTRSGSSRRRPGVDHGMRLSARRTAPHTRSQPPAVRPRMRRGSRRAGKTSVLDRPREITLSWAALCLALFAGLAWAVTGERTPLGPLDDVGRQLEGWADDHDALRSVLRFVEDVVQHSSRSLVLTLVLAALLVARRSPAGGDLRRPGGVLDLGHHHPGQGRDRPRAAGVAGHGRPGRQPVVPVGAHLLERRADGGPLRARRACWSVARRCAGWSTSLCALEVASSGPTA